MEPKMQLKFMRGRMIRSCFDDCVSDVISIVGNSPAVQDMAAIIGISRTAYQAKKKSGRFTAEECHKFCTYFGKSFEYLFAKDGDDYAS